MRARSLKPSIDAKAPGFVGALVLGLVLLSQSPVVAQTGAPSPSDPTVPGTVDPGGLSLGTVGATPTGSGTDPSSGPSESGPLESGGARPLPRPSTPGLGCAPPGSAAAFAGTSQPGLCSDSGARGGGSPGAGFSGGAAGSPTDRLVDPVLGAGGR